MIGLVLSWKKSLDVLALVGTSMPDERSDCAEQSGTSRAYCEARICVRRLGHKFPNQARCSVQRQVNGFGNRRGLFHETERAKNARHHGQAIGGIGRGAMNRYVAKNISGCGKRQGSVDTSKNESRRRFQKVSAKHRPHSSPASDESWVCASSTESTFAQKTTTSKKCAAGA